MIFPNVKNGSGLDNFGAKKSIDPTAIEEHRKVRLPTVNSVFRVDKIDGVSEVIG